MSFGCVGTCQENGLANVEDVCVEEKETFVLGSVGLATVEDGRIEGMVYVVYLKRCDSGQKGLYEGVEGCLGCAGGWYKESGLDGGVSSFKVKYEEKVA